MISALGTTERYLATGLWRGRTPQAFRSDLMRLPGVGTGLANMTVQLALRAFGDVFVPADNQALDIKCDVHTSRAPPSVAKHESDTEALQAARLLQPSNPGSLDAPIWWVGHTWCDANAPDCCSCALHQVCAYVESRAS